MTDAFDRRVLSDNAETARSYAQELSPEAADWLDARGIDRGIASRYQLGQSTSLNRGWITIPYLRPPRGVVWFNYRNWQDEPGQPKYKAPGSKHLFNTEVLKRADETGEVFVCEGEFDAIIATERYDLPAVAIPGATQWQGNPHWRELFVGYGRVWILADPDDAGLKLAAEITERLPAARLVNLPADVTDCWKQGIEIKECIR